MRLTIALLIAGLGMQAVAEDWPQWRGKDRDGVWKETGVLERFPEGGLKRVWSVPIGRGYTGPAVADGKVLITEFESKQGRKGVERAICLDEETGERIWEHEWEVDYAGLQYDLGPRVTPNVDGDRVYILGAMGDLLCLKADSGEVVWSLDYIDDFGAQLPTWGMVGPPLVDGDQLICLVGGAPNAKVMSFDKMTGKERWRALSSDSEPGYSPPMIFNAGGVRQLIIWTPQAVNSLDPSNGEVYWSHAFPLQAGLAVATPVLSDHGLLVSAFYNGSRMYKLDAAQPTSSLVWKGNSDSEIETDGLHALVTTPVVHGDHVYGIGSYGQFRCLDAKTGKRVWETMDVAVENARWASGQIVRNGDRFFINNDRGEFIIAKLSPEGYHEIDRVKIMEPTNPLNRRREYSAVHWTHPAYANLHMIIRNDKEMVRFSLAMSPERE